VKTFEESVFGPCTPHGKPGQVGRPWGTRPEPKTLVGRSNPPMLVGDVASFERIGIERIRGRSCSVPRTDCERGGDDTTTSVLRRKVTRSNFSAKMVWRYFYCSATFDEASSRAKPDSWCLGSLERARNPKRKGKGLQSLIWWFNSIPRLHLPLLIPRPCPNSRPWLCSRAEAPDSIRRSSCA
jgi:hypothetical protein